MIWFIFDEVGLFEREGLVVSDGVTVNKLYSK